MRSSGAITRAVSAEVQSVEGFVFAEPKTVMRYDHGRENLEQNAVNFLRYEDEV